MMIMMMIENNMQRLLLLLSLCLVATPAFAQTSRNELINDVLITDGAECALVRVEFDMPIKYKNHFPEGAGKELRVYLQPVIVTAEDRDLVNRNEYISPPKSDIVDITEIIYEGEDVVEPYLSVLFEHPVSFNVKQGADFRSLEITVMLPGSKAVCVP